MNKLGPANAGLPYTVSPGSSSVPDTWIEGGCIVRKTADRGWMYPLSELASHFEK
jgi:hypothetical protein